MKVRTTIKTFQHDPRNLQLRNHALSGKYHKERSISVTGDIRIIFREENNHQKVTLLRVGPHSQAYK